MSTRKTAPAWPYQVKGLLSTTEGYREVDVDPIEVKTGSVKEINAAIPSTMGFKIFWVLFEPPGYGRKFVIDFMAGKRLGKRDLDIIRESSPVQAWTSWVWAPKRWKINGKEVDTFISLNMGDPRWFAAWEKAFAGASRSSGSSRAGWLEPGHAWLFMAPSDWKRKHKDFKGGTWRKEPRSLVLNPRTGGTESWPVTKVPEGDPRQGKVLWEIVALKPMGQHGRGDRLLAVYRDRVWTALDGTKFKDLTEAVSAEEYSGK